MEGGREGEREGGREGGREERRDVPAVEVLVDAAGEGGKAGGTEERREGREGGSPTATTPLSLFARKAQRHAARVGH